MQVWSNIDGTSSPSFSIGIDGVTIHYGETSPTSSLGVSGDMYIRRGDNPTILQKDGSEWRTASEKFSRQTVAHGTTAAIADGSSYVGVTSGVGTTILSLPQAYMGKRIIIKNETTEAYTIEIDGVVDGGSISMTTGQEAITLLWVGEWTVIRRT